MAIAFYSILIGEPTTWSWAIELALSLTARQTKMLTIRWHSFRKNGPSRFHLTQTGISGDIARVAEVTGFVIPSGAKRSRETSQNSERCLDFARHDNIAVKPLRL